VPAKMRVKMRITSRAKLNLCLSITGRERDYHLVHSINAFVSLADDLTITPSTYSSVSSSTSNEDDKDDKDDFKLTASGIEMPLDETNLITQAARLTNLRARVDVHKRIPLRAGLGGGSSNAAEILKYANPLDIKQLATSLGSDVSFFLQPQPCLVTPTEMIAVELPSMWAVLAYTPEGLSTGLVYKTYGENSRKNFSPPPSQNFPTTLREWVDYFKRYGNDLSEAAFKLMPALKQKCQLMSQTANSLYTAMSGSGSTLFSLYATKEDAISAREALKMPYSYAVEVYGFNASTNTE